MMACLPGSWPVPILSGFCSQYGDPYQYPVLLRARLLGEHGEVPRLIDMLHMLIEAPMLKKGKKPEPWLKESKPVKPVTKTVEQRHALDAYMGVR